MLPGVILQIPVQKDKGTEEGKEGWWDGMGKNRTIRRNMSGRYGKAKEG
jgi:hypothetical protein